jgi:hypothetical protein
MTASSSSVILDDAADYLAPSQACINPAFQPKESNKNKLYQQGKSGGRRSKEKDDYGGPTHISFQDDAISRGIAHTICHKKGVGEYCRLPDDDPRQDRSTRFHITPFFKQLNKDNNSVPTSMRVIFLEFSEIMSCETARCSGDDA